MRFLRSLSVAVLTVAACTSRVSDSEPRFEFGKLRADLNGSEFAGIFGRDSVLAVWSQSPGQLQIQGDKRGWSRTEQVRVTMRCIALPQPGTYAIGNPFSPVSAEAFIAPTLRQRIWPLHGAKFRAFLSDSMPPGSLVLETVDSANRVIKGRFSAALRSVNRTPAETLSVHAAFFGRLDLLPLFPGPKVSRPARFQNDCERIRNAVPM
jgi:hypothetical protein